MERNAKPEVRSRAGQSPPAGFSLDRFSVLGVGSVPQNEALLFMLPPGLSVSVAFRAVSVLAAAVDGWRTVR